MATYTTNLNLKKPGAADSVNIADINGNMDTIDTAIQNNTDAIAAVIDLVYPIGAIYISVSSTSPATLFGGTWSAFGAGRVLVGINPSDTAFDTVEETGGAKTHTLTTAQIPSHSHEMSGFKWSSGGSGTRLSYTMDGKDPFSEPTGTAGSGDAHNNLQPYIVVYMWKRTA